MNFLISKDLEEFSGVLRKYLGDSFPPDRLKSRLVGDRAVDTLNEQDVASWQLLAELGVFSSFIPEKFGGLGLGSLALSITLEETARVCIPVPVFETLALGAVPLLLLGTEPAMNAYLPKIAAGELRLTGALAEVLQIVLGPSILQSALELKTSVTAKPAAQADRYLLRGSLELVPSLGQSQFVLVPAQCSTGLGLFLLDLQSASSHALQPTFDLFRSYSTLELIDVPAEKVSRANLSIEDWNYLGCLIAALVAAELGGLGDKVLAMSVDYAKTRNQFGKPIGSFQAVSHQLADMCVDVEGVRALCRFSAWTFENDRSQFIQAALSAKSYASEVIPRSIERGLQVHGGIGFTYEYYLHFYLRRARVLAELWGRATDLQQRMGRLVTAQPGAQSQ